MTIAEIRKMEEQRTGCEKTVHLIKEGDWYRTHDWSAWLMSRFPTGEAVEKPLKVTAKRMKDGYADAFVGFPCTSIGKYLPEDGSAEFRPVSDTLVDVVLTQVDFGDATTEQLREQVDQWKESLPMEPSKKQRREEREAAEQAPRIVRFTDIVNRIIALPIEDTSPREAYEILRDLRRQITAMF